MSKTPRWALRKLEDYPGAYLEPALVLIDPSKHFLYHPYVYIYPEQDSREIWRKVCQIARDNFAASVVMFDLLYPATLKPGRLK